MKDQATQVMRDVTDARATMWINESRAARPDKYLSTDLIEGISDARDRLSRFAPLLARAFPQLATTGGIVRSPLLDGSKIAGSLGHALHHGRVLIKADHALDVAGSIKARGGCHAVLVITEQVASEGLRDFLAEHQTDPTVAHARLSQHRISVGSTGNLGLSVGLFASGIGFSTTVHMSDNAKDWKKALLRRSGAQVVEHAGDYEIAVAAGRGDAVGDDRAHFIDDENSRPLLFGYATAISELAEQLAAFNVVVDEDHPLFVHVPCGVGGAPAGIALGLAARFGAAAHCFLVEPVQAPCMLVQMLASRGTHPSIYGIGLSGRTEADGLAVPRASLLAADVSRPLIAGILTVNDDDLFKALAVAYAQDGLKLEPSASAGFAGLTALTGSAAGRAYLLQLGDKRVAQSCHVVWTTGGDLVPPEEHVRFLERGQQIIDMESSH